MQASSSRRYIGEVVLRRYLIDRVIGEGSFAWVYHARRRTGEEVAVKVLHSVAETAGVRFAREVKVLRALPANPYVAAYVDSGTTRDGRPLLVLEHVDGITLKDGLERKPRLPPGKAVAFVAELCQAFVGLHQLGVAHRDVKPENILLARQGGIKLIDFGLIKDAQGILKLLEEEDLLEGKHFDEDLDRGVLAGTPEYMAPEQFSDSAVSDARQTSTDTSSDVFSLGVILFELLAGRKPFPMKTVPVDEYPRELLRYLRKRMQLKDSDLPEIPGVDEALASVVRKALRCDPRRRQPHSRELMNDLLRYLRTGEGIAKVDDSRTASVPMDLVTGAPKPAPQLPPDLVVTQPSADITSFESQDEGEDEDDEVTDKGSDRPPAAPWPPRRVGQGHSGVFFEQDKTALAPADPYDATAALDVATFVDASERTPRPKRAKGEPSDTVPTVEVGPDDLWPEENLADPPRRGEPDVPVAPTDTPTLSAEDLFNDLGHDDAAAPPDGLVESIFDKDTREVDISKLMPGEVDRRKRRERK